MPMIGLVVLIAYAAFELAMALGAPLGHYAWGGADEVLPAGLRVASAIAAVVYLALWVLLRRCIARASMSSVSCVQRRVLLGLALLFAIGVPLNLASRSASERWNAIGAALIAIAFFRTARAKQRQRRAGPPPIH